MGVAFGLLPAFQVFIHSRVLQNMVHVHHPVYYSSPEGNPKGTEEIAGKTYRCFYSPLAAISSVPLSDATLQFSWVAY